MTVTQQEFDALQAKAEQILSGSVESTNTDIIEELETYQMGLHTKDEATSEIIWHLMKEKTN